MSCRKFMQSPSSPPLNLSILEYQSLPPNTHIYTHRPTKEIHKIRNWLRKLFSCPKIPNKGPIIPNTRAKLSNTRSQTHNRHTKLPLLHKYKRNNKVQHTQNITFLGWDLHWQKHTTSNFPLIFIVQTMSNKNTPITSKIAMLLYNKAKLYFYTQCPKNRTQTHVYFDSYRALTWKVDRRFQKMLLVKFARLLILNTCQIVKV